MFGCSQSSLFVQQQHANVPRDQNGGLGRWVNKQRFSQRQAKLSKERGKLLSDIGFVWDGRFEREEELWSGWFHKLKQFKEEHGVSLLLHCHSS